MCLCSIGALALVLFAVNGRDPGQPRSQPLAEENKAATSPTVIDPMTPDRQAIAPPPKEGPLPDTQDKMELWSPKADITVLALLHGELELARRGGEPDSAAFKEAISKAKAAVDKFTAEEFTARRRAGLYTVLEPHEPGKPLNVKKHPRSFDAYTAEDGEWRLVHLPESEYPELYALSELLVDIEDELEIGMNIQGR